MTIARTGVRIDVEGADAAAAALSRVAAAERAARDGARGMAESLEDAQEWEVRRRIAVQDADAALVRKVRAEQAAKREMDSLLNPTREATKELGLMGRAAGLAGSGLSVLRKAAEIIPGMELGTIFAAIAAGAYALYKAFDDGDASMARQTAALKAQAQAARSLAQAQRDVLDAQVGAGASTAKRLLDRLGSGATPEAIDRAIRLGAQRDEAERAQGEAIQRMTRQAGGLVPVTNTEQRRIEELQAEINKRIEAAHEREDDGTFKLSFEERSALAQQAQAFKDVIQTIRAEASRNSPAWMATRVQETTRKLEDLDRQLLAIGIGGSGGGGGRAGGARAAGPTAPTFDELVAFQGRAEALTDRRAFARMDRESQARLAEDAARAESLRAGIAEFGKPAAGEPPLIDTPLIDALDTLSDSFTGTFDRMATSATDAASIMVGAIGSITGALGSMVTNLIIAGDAGSEGLGKVVGNALAGYSAQAFGFAILLEGMAVAAALTGPIFGWQAPGLAAAGGVMAGIGATLAVMARALGADKVGGGATGGGSGGGGGGRSSAANTNPFAPAGGGATNVTVVIGGEVVTRGVQVETRRQEMRGGVAASRMARAS
jgi:hypothetical protein